MSADAIPLPALVVRRLQGAGIHIATLLREAGLPPSLLGGQKAQVDTDGFFRLWKVLERLDGDPALGLRLADAGSPDQLDIASMAALHAASFGDALATLARYKRLVCPEDMQISTQGTETSVAFRWLLTQDPPPARLIDACFASVLLLARHGTGLPVRPLRVDFARPESHRAVFESHFEGPAHFGAPADRIVFATDALDLPFRTANPDLLAVLLPGLDAALDRRAGDPQPASFVDEVRAVIRTQMQGRRPMVDTVAGALALSPRTLQRKLGEHGTSYQQLLDGVRQQVACELLGSTDLANGEIAFLLGFEELNSFNRAFSTWQGTSPLRWRQRSQSAPSLQRREPP